MSKPTLTKPRGPAQMVCLWSTQAGKGPQPVMKTWRRLPRRAECVSKARATDAATAAWHRGFDAADQSWRACLAGAK